MRQERRRSEREYERVRLGAATKRVSVSVVVMAMLGGSGFLAASSIAHTATRTPAKVVSLRKTELGRILVNSKGHTLYLFARDRRGKSACSAGCAKFWAPLLTRGRPTAGPGVRSSLLGTTGRSSGSLQVTYHKHPLYTYVLDKGAGQTNGEGTLAFGARWYAVSAKGTAILKAPTTTTPTYPTITYPYP